MTTSVQDVRLRRLAASHATLFTFLVLPALVTLGLHLFPRLDVLFHSAAFHLAFVSAIAACALVVALLASVAAARSARRSLLMLAIGCLAVGVFMLAHGLTTPGLAGRPMNVWIARHPLVAITSFAVLAGFGAAVFAIVARYHELREVQAVLDSAFSNDPIEHIQNGYPKALRALVGAVETHDEYTHGHSARVATLAVRLGLRLNFKPEVLRALAQGAILHDVGKLGVPDGILNKAGPLDEDERRWIEQHPVLGYELARRSPSLDAALAAILHHHERWDGKGYPHGLAGYDIPLTARLVSVVDVWDALTTDRFYRSAWEPEWALAHMLAGRGGQFDPAMVDALAGYLAEQGVVARAGTGDPRIAEAALSSCHSDRRERVHAH